jgi:flagellin
MRINNNLMAMNTHRQLGISNTMGSKSMEKLSSGYRINRAGDDAAGLAISEKMRGQIRGLNQASRNAQDSISLVQTAEGALNEAHEILQRMRELAVQSSNDTNVSGDREALQDEIDQLIAELDRIGDTTEFNTKKLLNGGAGIEGTVEIAGVTDQTVSIVSGSADIEVETAGNALQLDGVTAAQVANITIDTIAAEGDITGGASFTINGTTVTLGADTGDQAGDTQLVIDAINGVSDTTGVTATLNGTDIELNTTGVGSQAEINLSGLDNVFAGTVEFEGVDVTTSTTAAAQGTDATVTLSGTLTNGPTSYSSTGNLVTIHGGSYDGLVLKVASDASAVDDVDIEITANNTLLMQIGANEGQDMSVSIGDMRSSALEVNSIDVTSSTNAKAAITTVQDAITTVSSERAKLGAVQNRLEHTIKNLDTSAENLQASESRIRDVDMAAEMMEFTKQNILQQAATAMLAQANQAPQSVLQLLQ